MPASVFINREFRNGFEIETSFGGILEFGIFDEIQHDDREISFPKNATFIISGFAFAFIVEWYRTARGRSIVAGEGHTAARESYYSRKEPQSGE